MMPSLLTHSNISSITEVITPESYCRFEKAMDVVSRSSGKELVVNTGLSM